MGKTFFRTKYRVFRRRLGNRLLPLLCGGLLLVGGISYASTMNKATTVVDPASYAPVLHLIGRVESNDNYNAYFGNPNNTEIKFTEMTVGEVLAWQSKFIAQGHASSAVGRYQIIDTTLAGLASRHIVDANQKFDEATQDTLAIALLERRGSVAYVKKELTPQEFAANIAKEWAALPRVIGDDPNASYYAGDGLNASRTSVDEVMKAIEPISAN